MEQRKIGLFLRELRKEKGLTQGQLAEQLHMSDRTVSRWETGATLPDLTVLVELADFYEVDIREIIDGERRGEKMEEELKDTLVKAAQYAGEEKKTQLGKMRKRAGVMIIGFGCFLILSAFTVFPSESGWGVKFAVLGAIMAAAGAFQLLEKHRLPMAVGVFIAVLLCMILMDLASVCYIRQAPRFSYLTEYSDTTVTYHAPLYSVVRYNRDTAEEYYEIRIGSDCF